MEYLGSAKLRKNTEKRKGEKKQPGRIGDGFVGKKAGCGSVENDRPEAETRAEDDLELDYEIRRKRVVRATILFLLPVNLAYCKWKKKEKKRE